MRFSAHATTGAVTQSNQSRNTQQDMELDSAEPFHEEEHWYYMCNITTTRRNEVIELGVPRELDNHLSGSLPGTVDLVG